MSEHFNDKTADDIRKSIDRIVPGAGKKEKMYGNILEKSLKKEKKRKYYNSFIKYSLPVAACLCVAFGIFAYNISRDNDDNLTPDKSIYAESDNAYGEGAVMGGNPFSDVDGAKDFKKLGIYIDAPDNAENVYYSIIDNDIADIRFSVDGHDYVYRASYQSGDFTGIYGEEEPIENIDAENSACVYRIEDELCVSFKVYWTDGSINYYLTNSDGADEADVRKVAKELIDAMN